MAASGTNLLAAVTKLKNYVFGPRLIRIFPIDRATAGRDYEPNNMEFFCDAFIRSVSFAVSFSIYSSPILVYYIYKKVERIRNIQEYLAQCETTGYYRFCAFDHTKYHLVNPYPDTLYL